MSTFAATAKAIPSQKIVVIGAGLAGLTAAYRLNQHGMDVEIYEARPRVGGRVHTVLIKNMNGSFSNAELGGQNITDGGNATHILSLVKELNLELNESEISFEGTYYDGETFHNRKTLISQILAANQKIDLQIEKIALESHSMQDVLEQLDLTFAQQSFLSFIMNAYEGLHPSLLSTDSHNLNLLKSVFAGGLSPAHTVSETKPLLHRISIKGGNATLPEHLAQTLENRIHLNKVLTHIKHDTNHQILLTFADGTKRYCNKLILAIPCTVYKNIEFNNAIDKKNLMQIHSVHYGTTTKILMPIQQENNAGHWLATSTMGVFFNDDLKLLNLYFVNDNGINLFDKAIYANSLTILKAGFPQATFNEHPMVEAKDENFVKYDTPVVKSWVKDPYAQGSYSAFDISLKNVINKRMFYNNIEVKTLFAPIHDKIFFIGEHTTILDEIGTMEAAVESGERIAKALALGSPL